MTGSKWNVNIVLIIIILFEKLKFKLVVDPKALGVFPAVIKLISNTKR